MRTSSTIGAQRIYAAKRSPWWGHLLWVVAAALVGFGVAALFSGLLQWSRSLFLVPHVIATVALFYVYMRWSGVDMVEFLRRRWIWGLVGATLAGVFLVMNVLSQPASPRSTGLALVFDLVWLGLVYGIADALLLSVLPILAAWLAFQQLGWTDTWAGRISVGFVALLMSLATSGRLPSRVHRISGTAGGEPPHWQRCQQPGLPDYQQPAGRHFEPHRHARGLGSAWTGDNPATAASLLSGGS